MAENPVVLPRTPDSAYRDLRAALTAYDTLTATITATEHDQDDEAPEVETRNDVAASIVHLAGELDDFARAGRLPAPWRPGPDSGPDPTATRPPRP